MRTEAEESFNRVISMAPGSTEAAESRKALARLHGTTLAPATTPKPSGYAKPKKGAVREPRR